MKQISYFNNKYGREDKSHRDLSILKKSIHITLALLIGLLSPSCSDYLDAPTKSSLDESVVFSDPTLAEQAVMGIIVSLAETNAYRGRFLPWYGMNTDCEWYNSSTNNDSKADLAVYRTAPSNSEMNTDNNAWAKMYEGIERANLAIRGLRNSGKAVAGTDLGYLLGETLTLRAIIYADLIRAWGDVPARFEPLTGTTIYVERSDRDVIYKQLLLDLAEAESLVYWPNESSRFTKTVTRINKTFVKALRARICLVAGGYAQRNDSETPRLSTDPELNRNTLYNMAKVELLGIYGNSSYGSLESSFETLFRKLCEENSTAGGESLWEIPFSSGRGRMAYTFAVRHLAIDQHTGMAQGAQVGPTPNLFYDYDVNDTRRDVTCVPYQWSNAAQSRQELRALNSWCFGKYRFEWMKRRVTSTNDDGLRKQYMRYAEVVLMLAEVTNELDGYQVAAPYLKVLRRRAFPQSLWASKVDTYVDNLTSKEAMFNAIVEEHAFEFAGEMVRKEALIRWNLLTTRMDGTKTKMAELREQRNRYSDVPTTVFYKYADDAETLILYGLNRGETLDKSAEFTSSVVWVGTGKISDEKINSLYARTPDKWQFWPIWQVFIDSSNGKLVNYFGY